jgi:thiamine biosynthesis protein ThiS
MMTETGMVRVHLNGDDREVPAGLTVRGLLEWLELNPALVVVEANRVILKRDSYDRVQVSAGDTLELVHFVGGG